MVDLYFWPTPNGYKVLLFLEEAGLAYTIKPVNIGTGEQFAEDFLRISPNNRMPALVDHEPRQGNSPRALFESGAILLYLAEKSGRFIPTDDVGRYNVLSWLFWQMAGLGPMAGQNHHFRNYAPEKIPYAIDRYVDETHRLYGVLDKQLTDRAFINGDDYSIADMASYPWILPENQGQDINEFPHLKRWKETIAERPATKTAYSKGRAVSENVTVTDESRKILFGQRAKGQHKKE